MHPDATTWMNRGQEREQQGTAETLQEAVRCYEQAITLLRHVRSDESDSARRDLGVAWMNRGNALQKFRTADSLAEAVRSYDATIALLRTVLPGGEATYRNTLGAAWMNRGLALHRQGTADGIISAIESHRHAIAILQTLPLDESPWYPRNLAAAWNNLANVLLDAPPPIDFDSANRAAVEALVLIKSTEKTEPMSADLALKARRVLVDVLGHRLSLAEKAGQPTRAMADEASDAIDEGLELVRHWEHQGLKHFRFLAARLFRFGAQLYRVNQPHFLSDFLLENLDPDRSPGAIYDSEEFHVIAAQSLATILPWLQRQPVLTTGDGSDNRLVQTWRDLKATESRLAELRSFLPPRVSAQSPPK